MKRLLSTASYNDIHASLHAYRCFGDDKLRKPKILKGLKPIKSFEVMRQKVHVYDVNGDGMMLQFNALFCKEASFPEPIDMHLPTSVLAAKYGFQRKGFKSFTYPDAWCTLFNRNEGYIMVSGLRQCFGDICGLHIAQVAGRLYECLRECSLQDDRFQPLLPDPTDRDGAAYYRLCEDIAAWLFLEARDGKKNA